MTEIASEFWPPPDAEALVRFVVRGDPKPAGSKDTGVVTRFDPHVGRRVPVLDPVTRLPRTFTKDSSGAGGKNWRSDVRQACADALDEAHALVDGPLAVRITFYGERPASHFGTGRNAGVLKTIADRFPYRSKLADGAKLCRAVEDALTKLLWTDDRRVVDCWWSRRFGKPGAVVEVFTLPLHVGDAANEADQLVIMGDQHGNGDRAEAIHF